MDLKADTILVNGNIHTMDETDKTVQAMAIEGERIAALGSNEDILKFRCSTSRLIDLKGKTVIPGLVESHCHIFRSGLSELRGELFMPRTLEELLLGVKERSEALSPGEWIYLRNIYPTRLREWRYPTLAELDAAAPENPVFLDGAYAGQANSKALALIGPEDTRVIRDDYGKPTGRVVRPFEFVRRFIPSSEYSLEDYCVGLENLQARYSRLGITTAIDASTDELSIMAANSLYASDRLKLRLIYTMIVKSVDEVAVRKAELKNLIETPEAWGKLSWCKVMLDGGILTGTAYMREPYNDRKGIFGINIPGYRGEICFGTDELAAITAAARVQKLQMTAHCIGNAASDILLDAYEKCNMKESIKDDRFSIIHADFTDRQTLEKMRSLGIALLFQPAWHFKDAALLEEVLDRSVMETFLPYRDYIDMEIKAAGGSDHMVKYDSMLSQNPFNPFMALYNMVTRKTAEGVRVMEEQRITRRQALEMYTCNGAFATFDEGWKGRLLEGMAADFAVLSEDYFNCTEEEIPRIESLLTFTGGRIVWDAGIL